MSDGQLTGVSSPYLIDIDRCYLWEIFGKLRTLSGRDARNYQFQAELIYYKLSTAVAAALL
jgi:hypothetical protein